MKKYIVEKEWLEQEGLKPFPDLYETVYLASDVDAEERKQVVRIVALETALRDALSNLDKYLPLTAAELRSVL